MNDLEKQALIKEISQYIMHRNESYYSILGEYSAECAIKAIEDAGFLIEKVDKRPTTCRNRLRDEGEHYPKSGCQVCKTGGMTGCPHERKN